MGERVGFSSPKGGFDDRPNAVRIPFCCGSNQHGLPSANHSQDNMSAILRIAANRTPAFFTLANRCGLHGEIGIIDGYNMLGAAPVETGPMTGIGLLRWSWGGLRRA